MRHARHRCAPGVRLIALGFLVWSAAACGAAGAPEPPEVGAGATETTDAAAPETTGTAALETTGAAASDAATVSVTPDLLRRGRTAYRNYCIQCHGYGGKGDGTSAASLDPPPRDHTDAAVMDAIPDLVVLETIRSGGAERGFANMPSFPHVAADELVALAAYVRSLSRPEVAEIEVGDIR